MQQFTTANKGMLNIARAIVVGINTLTVLPPILMQLGFDRVGNYFYRALGFFCHQRADRSFYLFGEQLLYSKQHVLEQVPFNKVFTLNFSQRFTCSDSLGCKFGVCSRCTGIYLGLLIGLLLAEIIASYNIPKLIPILMLLPLALDGAVQTIAYIIAPEQGFYESTNPRRFITGLLFGMSLGYFMVSAIKEPIAKRAES
jgi:uncharacterized membrane protein